MKVDALYSTELVTADVSDALLDAASRMLWNEISCLPVLDDGRMVGIITERDLARALVDEVDPARTGVTAYMAESPVTVGPGDECRHVASLMVQTGVRHLPVVSGPRLVGIVSARDLLALEAWGPERVALA